MSLEVFLHGLHSQALYHLVQDTLKVIVKGSGLSEYLEKELQEDASLGILDCHVALGAEH